MAKRKRVLLNDDVLQNMPHYLPSGHITGKFQTDYFMQTQPIMEPETNEKYTVHKDIGDLIFAKKQLLTAKTGESLAVDHEQPRTRKEIQSCFINFCLDHDLVDVKSHHYLIYRHKKLSSILKGRCQDLPPCDTIHPHDLFKYLRKFMKKDDTLKQRRKIQFLKNVAEGRAKIALEKNSNSNRIGHDEEQVLQAQQGTNCWSICPSEMSKNQNVGNNREKKPDKISIQTMLDIDDNSS
ncbi:hypothetical protein FGO68_gene7147 [Halteria grandinella]|uniref:Uncharacterized protein n=1 Tax=Halteria grandinella TaxID=5974 RepID=A0A8J8P2V5_HALGN|nr:hypothetical protein FGO68_gene7147 [Halteria grandinella]